MRNCTVCGKEFEPVFNTFQAVCGRRCAGQVGKIKRKAQARTLRDRKEAMKSVRELAFEAQVVVNRYVRLRDHAQGCISCDKPATWQGQWHASHLRSRGAAPQLRFHLWGIHKSCSICNNHKSGNIIDYLPRLVAKIGQDKVDWLYAQNRVVRYERAYLKRLKAVFAKKCRRLEKRIEEGKS